MSTMSFPPEPEPLPPAMLTLRNVLRIFAWIVLVAVSALTFGGDASVFGRKIETSLGPWLVVVRLSGVVAAIFLLFDSALRRRESAR